MKVKLEVFWILPSKDTGVFMKATLFLFLFRIQPLSEALDDLYKEFNALKTHLGDLTEKFSAIETFIDEVKAERANAGSAPAPAPGAVPKQTGRRLMRKKTTPSS